MTFVRNAWYVASWAHDLTTEPQAETILSENVVLWRGEDGKVRAAENVCPPPVPASVAGPRAGQ